MATLYSRETAGVGLNPQVKITDVAQRGRLKTLRATIDLASQANTDIIFLGNRPAGSRFNRGFITNSVSLATSTLSIGPIGTPAKYKALAAGLTAVDTPTVFGLASAMAAASLTADEAIYLTTGTTPLPATGILVIDIEYIES